MTLDYAGLSKEGLIVYPAIPAASPAYPAAPQDFFDTDRDIPQVVGPVPNVIEYAGGPDYDIGAFEIKAQGSRLVCLPDNVPDLLPLVAVITNDFYARAGAAVADQCQLSLQCFRTNYPVGEHLIFDRVHDHSAEGKMEIYVVTAVEGIDLAGTEFFSPRVLGRRIRPTPHARTAQEFDERFAHFGRIAAPGGTISRFSERTLHSAPDISDFETINMGLADYIRDSGARTLRRTLVNVIASYKLPDGSIYGRTRPRHDHRPSPVENIAERHDDYCTAAERVLAKLSSVAGDPVASAPLPAAGPPPPSPRP